MPLTKNVTVSVGKETEAGTEVARAAVVPLRGLPTIDKKGTFEVDPVIAGRGMDAGELATAYSVEGSLPLAMRPIDGMGYLLKSLLGTESVNQIGGAIRIRYTGAEASCKITANNSAGTIAAETGAKGSESDDSEWNSGSAVDTADTGTDTLGELVTVINGYTGFECEKIFGDDSLDASGLLDAEVQAKNMWAVVWIGSADSGVYAHTFTPDLSDDQRPTLSMQKDGFQNNYLYLGCVVDSLSMSAALKGFVEGEATIQGWTEETEGTEYSGTLADADPMRFQDGSTSIAANDYTFVRSMSLQVTNNHTGEGYGQGSLYRQENQKGNFEVTGEVQLRLDSTSVAERAKAFDGTQVALYFKYTGDDLDEDGYIEEIMLIELPYCGIREPDHPENNSQIDLKLGFRAFNPAGTTYNDPLTITIINTDSSAY